jgi:hypothetical protein
VRRSGPLLTALLALSCSQETIDVTRNSVNDYNSGALQAAVTKFVAANRTPAAYAELWRTVLELRPGMDRITAEQAELDLVVLALVPMKAAKDKPMAEQIESLALTVWPILIAKEIEADEILRKRDPKKDEILPNKGEIALGWLQRICGKQLAAECKQIVPEFQGHVVSALATRRGIERARNAVADCMMCATEPGWREAVAEWEKLDAAVTSWIFEVERKAAPANWPIAGAASQLDPGLPEAELAGSGEIIVGGQRFGATQRIDALRDLRFLHGADSAIALHLPSDLTLAQVKGILTDTRKSGAKRIAVVARGTYYPWERRIYWLSDTAGIRVGMRQSDTLQLLLHAVDHLGEPGAVARVD